MPRTVINKAISFDPDIFDVMEKKRKKFLMNRSEFIKRCVLSYLTGKTEKMEIRDVVGTVPEKKPAVDHEALRAALEANKNAEPPGPTYERPYRARPLVNRRKSRK
jgi:hypothetical protein